MLSSYSRGVAAAVFVLATTFSPYAHADTITVPINDPVTDTIQLWTTIANSVASLAGDLAALFEPDQFATSETPSATAPSQPQTELAAAAAGASLPEVATSTASGGVTSNANTYHSTTPLFIKSPILGTSASYAASDPAPVFNASAFVTQAQFDAAMTALSTSVQKLSPQPGTGPTPQYIAGDGNNANPFAAVSAIDNLSGVTISNANLSASEIPNLSGSYLSLNGGAVSGTTSFANDVGIGTTSPSDVLAVQGPIFLGNVSPSATSNRLYSTAGSLYWNGSLVGGGSVGNWTTDGTNVWRTGGSVGIGTANPAYALDTSGAGHFTSFIDAADFVATSSGATSLFNGNVTVNGNTTLANATTTSLFVKSALTASNAPWSVAKDDIVRTAGHLQRLDRSLQSPYESFFTQGAILNPRFLFVVSEKTNTPLGLPAGKISVASSRSANEKKPWKHLPSAEGVIETEFVRPLFSGESLLPYRLIDPLLAVVPCNQSRLLTASGEIELYPGLEHWWRHAEETWTAHRSSERLSLFEQLDFQSKLTKQLPVPPLRVVYNKSGMHLVAAKVKTRRALISNGLYWAPINDEDEADYLCAIMNSAITTELLRPFMSYGKDERDIHKHVWQLSIEPYNINNATHARLVELGKAAENIAATFEVKETLHFSATRRHMREIVEASGVGTEISAIVEEMLT